MKIASSDDKGTGRGHRSATRRIVTDMTGASVNVATFSAVRLGIPVEIVGESTVTSPRA